MMNPNFGEPIFQAQAFFFTGQPEEAGFRLDRIANAFRQSLYNPFSEARDLQLERHLHEFCIDKSPDGIKLVGFVYRFEHGPDPLGRADNILKGLSGALQTIQNLTIPHYLRERMRLAQLQNLTDDGVIYVVQPLPLLLEGGTENVHAGVSFRLVGYSKLECMYRRADSDFPKADIA